MKGLHILSAIKIIKYKMMGYSFGKNVYLGKGAKIIGRKVHIGNDVHIGKNVLIKANEISIGDNCLFFHNVGIQVVNKFVLGNRSKISRNTVFRANNIFIGEELWCNEGVEVGGGGWKKSTADLFLGDNVHIGKNVMINVCQKVIIGNQTGIGIETMILTHSSGHGQSILQGYEHTERIVDIGNNVSVNSRALILPGTRIKDGVVLGAMSYARGILDEKCLYLGIPAKKVRMYFELADETKYKKIKNLLENELNSSFEIIGNTDVMIYKDIDGEQYAIVLWNDYDEVLLKSDFQTSSQLSVCIVNISGNKYSGQVSCTFELHNLLMTGDTSFMSERLRDLFRRYGIIFKKEAYKPYILDYNELISNGIEI